MTEAEAAMWVKIAGEIVSGLVVFGVLVVMFCSDGINAWLANRGKQNKERK